MKGIRFFFGLLLAGGLLLSQVPNQGRCQMLKSSPAMACQMPCCKLPARMPLNCPMLKAAPAHDVIGAAPWSFSVQLPTVATLEVQATLQRILRSFVVLTALQTFCPTLMSPRLLSRAPPADVVTLAA